MNTKSDWMKRTGATPGKLALIAVLGVVLLAVLLNPSDSGSQAPKLSQRQARPQAANPRRSLPAQVPADAHLARQWPIAPLQEELTVDPFAVPSWAQVTRSTTTEEPSVPEAATVGPTPLELARQAAASQVVTAVMILDNEPVAFVGDRAVRVGDRLHGLRVAEITTAGITLADQPVETRRGNQDEL